ncbi:MAG: hypothetical protein JNM09_19325, partial [Blastocatellia bacterium]|nr:hypothetical protein [Blastocatellia bacterium]
MANNIYRIGIDLGGTKIAGTILDSEDNEIFAEDKRPRRDTEQEKGYANIVNKIVSLFNELKSH